VVQVSESEAGRVAGHERNFDKHLSLLGKDDRITKNIQDKQMKPDPAVE
jgi:hypothetical protein